MLTATNFKYRNFTTSKVACFISVDPLQFKAPFLNPYRYSANNPVTLNDPDGMWEFVTTNDKNGKVTNIQLKAQERKRLFGLIKKNDNWESLSKQMRIEETELEEMFGSEYKSILDKLGENQGTFELEDIKGEKGKMLQEMENAITNINPIYKKKGLVSEMNCFMNSI